MKKNIINVKKMFLEFFSSKKHIILPGSQLIPKNDPSLLFTNAGMNQFKNVFLGNNPNNYSRIATSQYCIRTGGKHNDLNNVGYSLRHHTLFEMLGNFSFGDYFKEKAILYAWELLTDKKWFNLPKEKFFITVYENDKITYNIWKNIIGIPKHHIICIGDKKNQKYVSDNFWRMGDNGPCGPCTEIFYDHGNHIPGDLPGYSNIENNRYVEIWNIVFMQFNIDGSGRLTELPIPSVDTGMGLERMTAVMQNVHSNYETSLFQPIIKSIKKINKEIDLYNYSSLYVIADHIRCCVLMISENILPSTENRGYVLRRIIRRAIRHGNKLGIQEIFLYKLVSSVIDTMSENIYFLKSIKKNIETVIKNEEKKFHLTLKQGLIILKSTINNLKTNVLDGYTVFNLYDTFGFPIDLTEKICKVYNLKIDFKEFKYAMEEHKKKSKKKHNFKNIYTNFFTTNIKSTFIGYDVEQTKSSILKIFIDNVSVEQIFSNQKAIIFLENTPFYGESGGQTGDSGEIYSKTSKFIVENTKKYGNIHAHIGILKNGCLHVNDIISAKINQKKRLLSSINHSSTHLLNSALRYVLNNSISQKGSLVNDQYLRFDFSYPKAISIEEIQKIEELINLQIRKNISITTQVMNFDDAIRKNAITLCNKKYTNPVRVVSIDNFSTELCGGTHVKYTGNIGLFRIISEKGIGSEIRRIEAVTGKAALLHIHKQDRNLSIISNILKTQTDNISNNIIKLKSKLLLLETEIKNFKKQEMFYQCTELKKQITNVKTTKLLISTLNINDHKQLRNIVYAIKNQIKPIIIVIFNTKNKKNINFITGVTKDLLNLINATEIMNVIIKKVKGNGGGKKEIAEGAIKNIDTLTNLLHFLRNWIVKKLSTNNIK